MTKADLKILERAFALDIRGGLLQLKSKRVKQLAADGYLEHKKLIDTYAGMPFTIEGYVLTLKGNMAYCESCKDEVIP